MANDKRQRDMTNNNDSHNNMSLIFLVIWFMANMSSLRWGKWQRVGGNGPVGSQCSSQMEVEAVKFPNHVGNLEVKWFQLSWRWEREVRFCKALGMWSDRSHSLRLKWWRLWSRESGASNCSPVIFNWTPWSDKYFNPCTFSIHSKMRLSTGP